MEDRDKPRIITAKQVEDLTLSLRREAWNAFAYRQSWLRPTADHHRGNVYRAGGRRLAVRLSATALHFCFTVSLIL